MQDISNLEREFLDHFGCHAEVFAHAPGRVNLIGDHTDYNDGFVLPAAINFGTYALAAKRADRQVSVIARNFDNTRVTFDYTAIDFNEDAPWSNYIAGVVNELIIEGKMLGGANIFVSGNVPQGSGLSSSASLEIAIVKAYAQLYQFDISGEQAAKIGQRAENRFVGCNCGIMDQFISALGQQASAMLLDCRNLTYRHVPLPDDLAIMIINSNVKRELVDSEYNIRRIQCEQVAHFFKKKALRDVALSELENAKAELESELYLRARHVISENIRTRKAYTAMQNGDIGLLSQLMADSHDSLQNDFAVTTLELDLLVEILSGVIGNKGGARMTGGGFGGCVVAILPQDMVDEARKAVMSQYELSTGYTPDIYVCTIESGAFSPDLYLTQ